MELNQFFLHSLKVPYPIVSNIEVKNKDNIVNSNKKDDSSNNKYPPESEKRDVKLITLNKHWMGINPSKSAFIFLIPHFLL